MISVRVSVFARGTTCVLSGCSPVQRRLGDWWEKAVGKVGCFVHPQDPACDIPRSGSRQSTRLHWVRRHARRRDSRLVPVPTGRCQILAKIHPSRNTDQGVLLTRKSSDLQKSPGTAKAKESVHSPRSDGDDASPPHDRRDSTPRGNGPQAERTSNDPKACEL